MHFYLIFFVFMYILKKFLRKVKYFSLLMYKNMIEYAYPIGNTETGGIHEKKFTEGKA